MASISPTLERFIRERLPSSEQIEIVLLLRGDRERAWSAPEVSQRLGTPPESTAMRLFLLASNGLVAFEAAGIPKYRYAPAFETEIAELADVWTRQRDLLTPIVGAGQTPSDPLRSFADAFKLKK